MTGRCLTGKIEVFEIVVWMEWAISVPTNATRLRIGEDFSEGKARFSERTP